MFLPTHTPPVVKKLLNRCLEKNPKQRLRDIGDARLAMEGAFETPAPAASDTAAPSVSRTRSRIALTAMIVIAIGALYWLRPRSDDEGSSPLELTSTRRLTSEVGLEIHGEFRRSMQHEPGMEVSWCEDVARV